MIKWLVVIGVLCAAAPLTNVKAQLNADWVPAGTVVPLKLTQEVSSFNSKVGQLVELVVAEDVYVNGTLVILAGSQVKGMITTLNGLTQGISDGVPSQRQDGGDGEIKIEARWVQDVNGRVVGLNDCWIYTSAQENPLDEDGALLLKGTRKNCATK